MYYSALRFLPLLVMFAYTPLFAKGSDPAAQRIKKLEVQVEALRQELASRPKDISAYELPSQISFCGESHSFAANAAHAA